MSEVENTTAADQPQQSSSGQYNDFLGSSLDLSDDSASEPSTGAEVEQAEVEEAEPVAEAEGEQQEEEASDDWLPTEQEKEFPPDVLAKYAKRYGYTPEEIAADPRLARALKDKINSDILISQQKQAETQTVEEPPREPEAKEAAQPEVAQQYDQYLDSIASQFDPTALSKLGETVWESMGGTMEQLKEAGVDPKKIGGVLARGALDLNVTSAPAWLPSVIEQIFPGFASMYQSSMYAQQWDSVRSTKEKDGSQPYAKLPAYGTEQFQSVLREAAAQIPGFESMVFTKTVNGKQVALAPHEQARQKYQLLARIAAGQQVKQLPAVKEAVETGKRLAKEADRSRQNAKILGAGQSTKQFTPAQGADPLDDAIAAINAESSPFTQRKR